MAIGPILIVDDEPLNLDAMRQVLERDYSLVFARNGKEALAATARHHPLLILMDIQMPEMDGYDACLALTSAPETAHIPVIFVTSLSDEWDEATGFDCGAVDYIVKPISPLVVRARVKTHLSLIRANRLEQSYQDAIYMLGRAGHFNDNDTGVHIWRMAAFARELASAVGWDSEGCHTLELAAPMHDTGKLGIPGAILRKPAKLDDKEWEVMKTHAQIGYDILSKSNAPVFRMAAEIALRHHEKWDGSGYPDGLAGEAIPESARIVAVADVFDALTMKRPYKDAWPIERVVETLKQGAGSHFDPRLVASFVSIMPRILAVKAEWDAREASEHKTLPIPSEMAQGSRSDAAPTATEVIQSHREWKVRFFAAMKSGQQLNVAEIASDRCCKFGKWLHAEGREHFGQLAGYRECILRHAAFHEEAGQVARLIDDGQFLAASQMLSYGSAYARASEQLMTAVITMFDQKRLTASNTAVRSERNVLGSTGLGRASNAEAH